MNSHIRKQSRRKLLSSYYLRIIPFSSWAPKGSKYHLAVSTTTVLANCSKKGRVELCVMQSYIRKQSLRRFLCSYYVRIVPFSQRAPTAPKYHFAVSTTTVLANCSKKGKLEPCAMKSHIRKQSLRRFLSSYYRGYFLFQHGPLWAPKYHFAESSTTVLANCSKKGSVELCVLKSPIRKQSLRKLPSDSYVRILLFSQCTPNGSQISVCRIHDNSVSKLFQDRKVELCVMKSHI